MLASHEDAERRYDCIRKEAIRVANEILQEDCSGVSLSTINNKALNDSKLWDKSKSRAVDWDWVEGYSIFRFRYPKRFEMALWENQRLILDSAVFSV
ncbi:MAG: hypothetical protein ACR2PX_12565 [Endozoicomonas sp.]|uniref:hypothetical protein n=1 Tax=Endozoicomonas sp. TaxID=1892382 RepID=UPI003D9B4C8F